MFLLACSIFVTSAATAALFAFSTHFTGAVISVNCWFPWCSWHLTTLSPSCSGSRLVHRSVASQSTYWERRSANFCCFIDRCRGVDNLKYHRGQSKVVTWITALNCFDMLQHFCQITRPCYFEALQKLLYCFEYYWPSIHQLDPMSWLTQRWSFLSYLVH